MVSLPTVALRSGINGGFYSLSFPVVQKSLSVNRRGRREESLLQPCAATIWAELCCRAVHTHCISHEPLPCYYLILGHQQIEAVFQLFPNISSCMERTPVQRHTQWLSSAAPRAFYPQETFNMTLSPPDTTLCLCGREAEWIGTGLSIVLLCWELASSTPISTIPVVFTTVATIGFWQQHELIFEMTSSLNSAGNWLQF